jgi:hypothetical protein
MFNSADRSGEEASGGCLVGIFVALLTPAGVYLLIEERVVEGELMWVDPHKWA